MRSLFFQDHCGVLDVFQMCLTVFSSFSPGVRGRNWLFLQLDDSLPSGGCQPARTPCVGLCSPHCPELPQGMVKGVPPFVLVGHAVSLWSLVLRVTPWRAWPQAANCLAGSLREVCTWRRASLFSRLGVVPSLFLLKARTEFCWNRLMNLFSFVHLVLQSRIRQEGFAWLGNQALWVNLQGGCPGDTELQHSDTRQLSQWTTAHAWGLCWEAAMQLMWLGGHSPPVLCAGVFLRMLKSSQWELLLLHPGHGAAGRAPWHKAVLGRAVLNLYSPQIHDFWGPWSCACMSHCLQTPAAQMSILTSA